jgi:hypothetical protein
LASPGLLDKISAPPSTLYCDVKRLSSDGTPTLFVS